MTMSKHYSTFQNNCLQQFIQSPLFFEAYFQQRCIVEIYRSEDLSNCEPIKQASPFQSNNGIVARAKIKTSRSGGEEGA